MLSSDKFPFLFCLILLVKLKNQNTLLIGISRYKRCFAALLSKNLQSRTA